MQPGYIYKISSTKTNLFYIGSTRQGLKIRFSKHKHDLKRYNEGNFCYVSSFDIMIHEDAKIEILKYFDNINNIDLKREENKFISENRISGNICNRNSSHDETAIKICDLCNIEYNKKFPLNHYCSNEHQQAIFDNA